MNHRLHERVDLKKKAGKTVVFLLAIRRLEWEDDYFSVRITSESFRSDLLKDAGFFMLHAGRKTLI